MDRALRDLARSIGGTVATDAPELARVSRDGSHLRGTPAAVVGPRDAQDVVRIVGWARRHRVPLVARGGGTSLDGESVPGPGAVVVDLSGWTRVREVRADDGWARVEPGVPNLALQQALAPHGAFFPPNPGSWATSTIGGNVATNASGPRSFRYGPTRLWVREIELVLGDGARTRWGSRVRKRSVGPDLVSLFVGSEGTLGIATEITVRIAPRPPVRRGLVVPLPEGVPPGRVAVALGTARGTALSAIEYLDAGCAAELAGPGGLGRVGPGPLVLLEVEAEGEDEADRREAEVVRTLGRAGVPTRPERFRDADELWSVRGQASVALDRRFGERIREDVAVPPDRIDALVGAIGRIAGRHAVPVYLFGHLGEGSLHPNFVVPPASPAAARIRRELVAAALALGGTISAEHGIGALKAPHLERELGRPGVDVLRALKRACDPDGILNPGKLYPPRAARRSSRSPSGAAGSRSRRAGPTGGSGRGGVAHAPRPDPRRRAARP